MKTSLVNLTAPAGPSVPIAAWMGGRYDAEPVGAAETLDHCSTCKTVWPVSLLTYDGQEEWHCPTCVPAPLSQSAEQLRRGLARYVDAVKSLRDVCSSYDDVRAQSEARAYRQALSSLHIFTNGEFGERQV